MPRRDRHLHQPMNGTQKPQLAKPLDLVRWSIAWGQTTKSRQGGFRLHLLKRNTQVSTPASRGVNRAGFGTTSAAAPTAATPPYTATITGRPPCKGTDQGRGPSGTDQGKTAARRIPNPVGTISIMLRLGADQRRRHALPRYALCVAGVVCKDSSGKELRLHQGKLLRPRRAVGHTPGMARPTRRS